MAKIMVVSKDTYAKLVGVEIGEKVVGFIHSHGGLPGTYQVTCGRRAKPIPCVVNPFETSRRARRGLRSIRIKAIFKKM